jgi:hypothetical protein
MTEIRNPGAGEGFRLTAEMQGERFFPDSAII